MVDHHWLTYGKEEEFIPNLDKFGFVYLITNLKNGKGYIGCKQYLMYSQLKERESNWKIYTGSSKWLNKDIKKIGKEHFKFEDDYYKLQKERYVNPSDEDSTELGEVPHEERKGAIRPGSRPYNYGGAFGPTY